MKSLKGKRLLLLGGSMWKEVIKQYAKEQGIVLIATGNNTNAGIFEIADETYLVDSTDNVAMKKLIIDKEIDGVYMGGSEAVISHACEYLKELDLPCYCTKKQWEFLQDKSKFKDLCIKFGLPVVPKFKFDFTKDLNEQVTQDCFPLITKPTDGCGSNGFSVSTNVEELRMGYNLAKSASPTECVIVEKFVKNDGVVVFYTFNNGKAIFSGLENKYPVRYDEHESYVAGLHLFESSFTQEFRNRFEKKLEALFTSLDLREGSLWIEVFHDDDNYYFNEVGFRYSGSVSVYPVDYFYHINQVAADIYYALTGESQIFGHESMINKHVNRKKYYCIYPMHMLAGEISAIEGVDKLKHENDMVAIIITKHVGDKIESNGTVAQVFAFVHFVFDSLDECKLIIQKLHKDLKVFNSDRQNLLVQKLNWDERNITI